MMGQRLPIVRSCSVFSNSQMSLTLEAVRLVTVEALGVCRWIRQSRNFEVIEAGAGVRFLTIGTCFLAATIYRESV